MRDKYQITKVSQLKKILSQKNKDNLKSSLKNSIKLTKQQEIGLELHSQLKKVSKDEAIKITTKIKTIISKNIKDITKTKTKLNIELAGSLNKDNNIKQSKDIDILITVDDTQLDSKDLIENSNLLHNIVKILENNKIITHTITLGNTKFLGVCRLNDKRSIHRH